MKKSNCEIKKRNLNKKRLISILNQCGIGAYVICLVGALCIVALIAIMLLV